ncbi:DUF3685 domain-containing protein [Geminocystis sp.]|uniref:DUF3685 domain-containing protein n=1 Tax=Geminocystis sp. TaxID=2664100 RepID=UPI003593FD7E
MSSTNSNETEISLILLDDNNIFTLGLREVLNTEEFKDINIIATGKIADFSSLLKQYEVNLWVISLDFNQYPEKVKQFLKFLPQLSNEYPHLSLVILVSWEFVGDFSSIPIIKGSCYKNADVNELVKTFRICAKGETYFSINTTLFSPKINSWFSRQCKFGLQQIQGEIINIDDYIKEKKLSIADVLYWQGRKRELKLAKWLITQLSPDFYEFISDSSKENNQSKIDKNFAQIDNYNSQIIVSDSPQNTYDLILLKIQSSLKNSTSKLLEIDILQESKKQELLMIILQEWIISLKELKNLNIDKDNVSEKINIYIKELWQNSTIKFLNRYYLPESESDTDSINSYSLLDLVMKESESLLKETVPKVPFILDIISYEIYQQNLVIDNETYEYDSKSNQDIEAIIIENIIIHIANLVIEFTLNKFSDNTNIKHKLFNLELKSSRKVAMFRNNLIWKYRKEKYWQNPKNIFEDQYEMLKLGYQGIETCIITHSRHQELKTIQGLPWAVTILIELRDSLYRVVQSLERTIGKVVVYLLTEVIGGGIGLIGKGILQGIGNRIKN